jgi:hypothetical protein
LCGERERERKKGELEVRRWGLKRDEVERKKES